MPNEKNYDLGFRPDTYFPKSETLTSLQIKGETRRQIVSDAAKRGTLAGLPGHVFREEISEQEKNALGWLDPASRSGEDLPDYFENEVEIARVQYAGSIHEEVTSIRARHEGGRIRYRVSTELDDTTFVCTPESSDAALTFREIVTLIQSAETDFGDDTIIDSLWESWSDPDYGGGDPDELRGSVCVTSEFYPRIGEWFDESCEEFIAERFGERAADSA